MENPTQLWNQEVQQKQRGRRQWIARECQRDGSVLKKSGEASRKVALLNPGTTGPKHFFEESCPKLPVSTLFSLCKGILSELGSRESSAEGNETRAWSNLMTD